MKSSNKNKPRKRERVKFPKKKNIPEATPELEIEVLEWLIKKCELRKDYETAAVAYERIQELREEMAM